MTEVEIEMIPIKGLTSKDFQIGKYPVTQKQWESIMGANPSFFNGEKLPVENVSWDDVQIFIKKLNSLTGVRYRLPTEAEWLVCATIDGTMYSGSNNLDKYGWSLENSGYRTHNVGEKLPNSLGIYDMSGNVWEWCEDLYNEDENLCFRVCRGGSWYSYPGSCRAVDRFRITPDNRWSSLGFRVAI